MNVIELKGIIKNIQFSHTLNDIEYYLANIITNDNGKESINKIKFKKFCNRYKEDDLIELLGNIRNYSNNGSLDIYIFTYFDIPKGNENNKVNIDGRICKIDLLKKNKQGKDYIHFILANNIYSKSSKINVYIPCTAWGKTAKNISNLLVNDKIEIKGKLLSREYKKHISADEIEIRVAHELLIEEIYLL